jgi:hypothetical protein
MFRFTIRELVLLTLVVALGVEWWLDHRRLELNRAAAQTGQNPSKPEMPNGGKSRRG